MAVHTLVAYCTLEMPSSIWSRLWTKAVNSPQRQPYRQETSTRGSMEQKVIPPPSAQGPLNSNMDSTVPMAIMTALSTRRRVCRFVIVDSSK